jgi:hypothetical protein
MSKKAKQPAAGLQSRRRISPEEMNRLLRAGIVRPEDYVMAHGAAAAARVGIVTGKAAMPGPAASQAQPSQLSVVAPPPVAAPSQNGDRNGNGKRILLTRKQLEKLLRTAAASARTTPDELAAAISAGLRGAPIQVKVNVQQPQAQQFVRVVKDPDTGALTVERSEQPFS